MDLCRPQYTVTFNNWQVNHNLPESDFNFTVPAGVKKTNVNAFKNALQQGEDNK
jgi:hypothetical protein